MKSLIILKGLAKTEKQRWVKSEKLENYYLDISVFKKLYSSPELLRPEIEILNKSHGNLIHQRFMEALIIKLSKGCLVIVDLDDEPVVSIETLALIHGYTVFYCIQPIPQDYCNCPRKYCLPWQAFRKKEELENDVKNFLNLQLTDKLIINSYSELLEYWEKEETVVKIKSRNSILHISDLHSNWTVWKDIISSMQAKIVVHHGDYIDGPEEGGSKKLISEIIRDNGNNGRYWLEGNHEIRLRRFLGWLVLAAAGNKTIADIIYSYIPQDFLNTTAKEFEKLTPKEARKWLIELNNKLKTHIVIVRDGKSYICTHTGIKLVEQLSPKHIGNVIYGNRDIDKQDKEFAARNKETGFISVHAHCKYPQGWNTTKYDNVVNIDPEDENKVVVFENNNKNWNFKVWQK